MEPPSLKDWLAQTDLGALSVRSPQLRDLDKTIEAYGNNKNPGERARYLSRIQQALVVWGRTCPGNDARNSSRNKGGAVTRLMSAVYQQKQITKQDEKIFEWQEEKRRQRMEAIFRGKSVLWKAGDPIRDAMQAIKDLRSPAPAPSKPDFKGFVSKAAGPFRPDRAEILDAKDALKDKNTWAQRTNAGWVSQTQAGLSAGAEAVAFKQMISCLFNGGNSAAALSFLGTSLPSLIADSLPIISLVKSGAQMLYYWGRAAQALWQEDQTKTNSSYLSGADDIAAALKALAAMLDQKTTQATLTASIQTADFGARGVSLFVDAGTASSSAIGAISNLAKLVQKLYLFARELTATRRANRLLSSPDNYGLQLFEAYPLLGCYMLCCSDTSELISLVRTANLQPYTAYTQNNWKQVQFGEVGWMDKVEFIKREHIDPVLEKSISFINASPFYIPGMAMHVSHEAGALNKLGWVGNKLTAAYNLASIAGSLA